MIAIVLDRTMKDTRKWKRNIGLSLSTKLYVDLTGNVDDQAYLKKQLGHLQRILDEENIRPSISENCGEEKGIYFHFHFKIIL